MIRQATISDKDIIRDMIIKSYIYHCNVCPSFSKKVKTNTRKSENIKSKIRFYYPFVTTTRRGR